MSGRRRRLTLPIIAVITLGWLLALVGTTPAQAVTAPLTVTITSVDGVGDDLDGIGRGDADLYAGITFDRGLVTEHRTDGTSFDTHVDDDPNITPFWAIGDQVTVFTVNSVPTARITISIWDHDDCTSPFCPDEDTGTFESGDDQLDINPRDTSETLDLDINMNSGAWTGGLGWPQNCVTGDSGEAVKVCFDISTQGTNGDADGDFLLDGWETLGYNADGDSTLDVDLPFMGAHPGRKDLFLEVDCMVDNTAATGHTHCLTNAAVQAVVQAFADAPVNNIDSTQGIQLHIDIGGVNGAALNTATNVPRVMAPANSVTGTYGNYGGGGQINEAGNTIIDEFDTTNPSAGTNFFTLKNMNANRDFIFRYGISGHQTNARRALNDCTSGQANGIPGVNFMVTLGGVNNVGNRCWGGDVNGFSVGNQTQQAGTLMHEFGHTLGLRHGGVDNFNNKPNYLSVMNYGISTGPGGSTNDVQACGVPAIGGLPGGCDYSRNELPTLNEAIPPGLDECVGIGLGLGSFNWNGDAGISGASCSPSSSNTTANVNGDFNDTDGDGNQDPGETNMLSTLPGAEDWSRIFYGFRTLPNFQTAGVASTDEPDPDSIAAARQHMANLVRPAMAIDKTGPATADPGDTLSYGLKVTNTGRGPALAASMVDTKPDGTTATFALGTVQVGTEPTRSVTYFVPCTTADGTVLTNSARVDATDLIANPFSASDSVTTTVQAPVLSLTKTATETVNAGEAITYQLTYANTGTGSAASVTITDTLPAGVYYSSALDQGAGPAPTTVANNANGTTTLTWSIGTLAGSSGSSVIEYTARPGLLSVGGDSVVNSAQVTFTNDNGCTYSPVTATDTTGITEVTPTGNPEGEGFWKTHQELQTGEILARIQATDQRYDGVDGSTPDGELSVDEAVLALSLGGTQAEQLRAQLLATYFNLADRRINASTSIESKRTVRLGLDNVREAAIYGLDALGLPLNRANANRYSSAIEVLNEINTNKSPVF